MNSKTIKSTIKPEKYIGSVDHPFKIRTDPGSMTNWITHLLENNSLGVGSSSERIGLPPCSEMGLLVVLVSPNL